MVAKRNQVEMGHFPESQTQSILVLAWNYL